MYITVFVVTVGMYITVFVVTVGMYITVIVTSYTSTPFIGSPPAVCTLQLLMVIWTKCTVLSTNVYMKHSCHWLPVSTHFCHSLKAQNTHSHTALIDIDCFHNQSSPSADPTTPGPWQGSHRSANF